MLLPSNLPVDLFILFLFLFGSMNLEDHQWAHKYLLRSHFVHCEAIYHFSIRKDEQHFVRPYRFQMYGMTKQVLEPKINYVRLLIPKKLSYIISSNIFENSES